MKKIIQSITLLVSLALYTLVDAQTLNTNLLGQLSYNQNLSEVRGAFHNGREYALVGVNNGFSIVDVTNPAAPAEVFFEPGANSTWRDPFYHNGYAYCVTEGGGGLLIVDMSPLPGSTALSTTLYTGSTYDISSCHNMFIESATNKAYLFGGNDIDGVIVLDISNPAAPVELGIWNDHYIHDGFVRGDTLWAACLEEGAFVVDISVVNSPVILANWDTPSEFAHNIWPSDDNSFCYTTDEVNSGFVAVYDMSDLQNVVEVDKERHPLSSDVIPHNSHFINNYVVSSHYRDGLTIHDVSDPTNIILTGYYDSSPLSGGGFNGSWGAWPYLPSGNLLIADIEEGLFVIGANYKRAARLEGNVTEFGTGNPLNDVFVEVVGAGLNENTNLFGDYATGTEAGGTYNVTFQKGGYLSQTITGVVLVNGQIEVLDVELVADVAFNLTGTVTEEGTGNGIDGAFVRFVNPFFDINLTSDGNGEYVDTEFYAGEYEVTVGAWGFEGECQLVNITSSSTPPSFELTVGYHDDFTLDLGWTVSGDATAGLWDRNFPVETIYESTIANPGSDADGDCGGQAYCTGSISQGNVSSDDVDGGVTILHSPIMDLSNYINPQINFDYWFFNDAGNSDPNDQYVVKIDNGTDVATVASLPTTQDQWTNYTLELSSVTVITSTMQLIIEVDDSDPGHLVEGGLDKFRVWDATSVEEVNQRELVTMFPNPANNFVNIDVSSNGHLQIFDATGKLVSNEIGLEVGQNEIALPVQSGMYICEITLNNERHFKRLLIN